MFEVELKYPQSFFQILYLPISTCPNILGNDVADGQTGMTYQDESVVVDRPGRIYQYGMIIVS